MTLFESFSVGAKLRLATGASLVVMLALATAALLWKHSGTVEEKRLATRHIVESAHSIVAQYEKRARQGAMTREAAQKEALAALGALRYGAGDYVWVNDLKPVIVMHPTKPELDGKDASGIRDPKGKALFVEFADLVKAKGSGFVDYLWPKPGADAPVRKVSYVQGFEPWGWVIGSGIYLDDLDAALRKDMIEMLALMAGIAAVFMLLAEWMVRAITRPLRRAVDVAESVAAGDLSSEIEASSNDETGKLLDALAGMNESLRRMVVGVRSGTDGIAVASREIASGNADLSSRTEHQASNLEETASAMEELATTVRQNAEHAEQANQLAVAASEVAVRGGTVVGEVVQTMSSIKESSSRIADIIGVIDGIAFQTNILALNAAVEAARAGEQGRGFAVVATEVRTLAQRSAGAAKEIKQLISDSVARVDDGTRLVDQAGRTMDEIVRSVRRVTDIMGEISSASREQNAGIEQVNQAVMQMDQLTQQNAALVEEAAAAADAMQEQAEQLSTEIAVFTLSGKAHAVEHAHETAARPNAPRVERRSPGRAKNVARIEPRKAAALASSAGRDGHVATARFRKQHEELGALAGKFAATLDAEALETDAHAARKLLSELAGKITMHLAMEDKHLYPSLVASRDTHTRELATRYMAEMGSIAEVFTAYTQRWSSAGVIQKNAAAFVKESNDILSTLGARIKRENSELYVAADRLVA
jgi:methyl-accepting chemotaxis protein